MPNGNRCSRGSGRLAATPRAESTGAILASRVEGRRWVWALALIAAGCVVTVIGVQVDLV